MKKFLSAFLVLGAVSCTKNVTSENDATALQSTTGMSAENAVILHGNTKFGCLPNGSFTVSKRTSVALSLNAPYVRNTISMDQWNGKSGPYESYVNSGLKVVLNVLSNQQTGKPIPFPKDMSSYRSSFNSITDKYQPEVIVVENEEINQNYHSGPKTDYINMLQVALDVCHSKGIKVTNGGIYGSALEILTYRYLQTKGQKRADSFSNNCMANYQVKAAQNPGSNPDLEFDVRQMDTLLNFYVNLDYINIHPYEPFDPDLTTNSSKSAVSSATPVVLPDLQEYLIQRTGKPVMTNETGQRDNTSPSLVTSMLQLYDKLNFPYAIWYSGMPGDIAGAMPLYNTTTGVLQPNGTAFSTFNLTY